jgi:hypothetical protein
MYTDIVVGLVTILLFLRGASRGFLQSIIGPLAFAAVAAISLCYYTATQNIFVSLLFLGLGQMVLYWLLKFLIGPGKVMPSFLSRLAGALITWGWGMLIILPVIFILSFTPTNIHAYAKSAASDIKSSKTFWVASYYKNRYFPEAVSQTVDKKTGKPEMITIQALSNDEKMAALRDDPEIIKAVKEKNYSALLSNPKFAAIMKDPELVKKIMAVYTSGQFSEK